MQSALLYGGTLEVPAMQQTLQRLPRVMETTGLKRASLYAKVKSGEFPKPVKIGARAVAWVSTDVERWVAQRIGGAAS